MLLILGDQSWRWYVAADEKPFKVQHVAVIYLSPHIIFATQALEVSIECPQERRLVPETHTYIFVQFLLLLLVLLFLLALLLVCDLTDGKMCTSEDFYCNLRSVFVRTLGTPKNGTTDGTHYLRSSVVASHRSPVEIRVSTGSEGTVNLGIACGSRRGLGFDLRRWNDLVYF